MMNEKNELMINSLEIAERDNCSWHKIATEKTDWSTDSFPPRKKEIWDNAFSCQECLGCPYHKIIEELKETQWQVTISLISSCGGEFDSDPATGRTWCKERKIVSPIPTLQHKHKEIKR
jgi:hypothetical protein